MERSKGATEDRARLLGWLASAVLALGLGPVLSAEGSVTAPALRITAADSQAGAKGTLVRVTGEFPFADMVGRPYPLQLFIRETTKGKRFVCFSVPWGVMTGKHDVFVDGLDEADVSVISEVAKLVSDAAILQVSPRQIRVQLPESFPAGPAEAQIFVMYEGAPVFSNTIRFEIEQGKW